MADVRSVRFESTALGGVACEVQSLEGEDELNHLFWYTACLVIPGHAGASRLGLDLLGKPASLVFEESGREVARVHGVAAEVRRTADAEADAAVFSVTLVPRAWTLTRTHRSELFLGRTIPQILAELLSGAGFEEGRDFLLATRERDHPARELVAQYGERDWDFLSRLCEDQGITFFFQHRGGRDVLVLCDTPRVFARTPDDAARLPRVRAEELGATHEEISGKSTEMTLRAGAMATLVDDFGDERPLLITKVVLRSSSPGEASLGEARSWRNEFTAIPADVPYRPPRRASRPKIPGLVHAIVEGALSGPHAGLDPVGRYKVRFRYDLFGRGDLLASRPVPRLKPHAGARSGLHFPLQPGTEVLIGFVEGDPDRPVVVGAVPNAEAPSPVEQVPPTQDARSSVAGDEGVIEDAAGSERVRVRSPRDTLQLDARGAPEVTIEGGVVIVKAAVIRLIGDVTIVGSLDVAGGIRGVVQGR